ncbi:MAG: peptide/nickel transport system permease protein [Actinomycetota bacterium]|nr:peptide/nickel transport system permease protein [Actinomycetota bacterium]
MRGSIRGSGLTDLHREQAVVEPDVLPELTPGETLDAAVFNDKPLTPSRLAWRRFRRHKLALISAVILLVVILLAVFAPLLTKFTPTESGTGLALKGPSSTHPMGTDQIGRDVWTQVLYGGRVSLLVGIAVAVISTAFGTIVGSIAGFYGKWVDNLLMRVTDLFLAIPLLVILIIGSRLPARQHWAEVIMGNDKSIRAVVTILTFFFWMPVARVVRGLVLSLKEKEFVEAARASGGSDARIIGLHLVPNCTGQIVVNTTLSVAAAILTESALSFLGFGVDPVVTPTWGNLLNTGNDFQSIAPWMIWFPGLAIVVTVLCVNFLGDGLRDALDPKQAGLSA